MASQISHRLQIPIRLVRDILYELVQSGVVTSVKTDNERIPAYQPASDINGFTIRFVIEALERNGIDNLPIPQSEAFMTLSSSVTAFRDMLETAPENRLLKDI